MKIPLFKLLETAKNQIAPFTEYGPNYSRGASEWSAKVKRHVFGWSPVADTWVIVEGFAIVRTIKGRTQHKDKLWKTVEKIVDRLSHQETLN